MPGKIFDKEIQKLKIVITSKCTLRCTHCNINHTDKTIKEEYCYKAIDFFMRSKGIYKRLELYGGEPLIEFDLLKRVINYTKTHIPPDKKISISIATNLTVLSEEIIDFIKKNRINVSISFSGTEESHNYNRRFLSGKGSYNQVRDNIKVLIKNVDPRYLVCLYCIDRGFLDNFERDVGEIKRIGFRVINFEMVHGCGWTRDDYIKLEGYFQRLPEYLSIDDRSRYLIPESFISYIAESDIDNRYHSCPFYRDMELYVDGYFGFYPYAFLDYERYKDRVVIGRRPLSIGKKFLRCRYTPDCLERCVQKYYSLDLNLSDGSYAYKIRTLYLKRVFVEILRKSRIDKNYKNYLERCREIFNLTYI